MHVALRRVEHKMTQLTESAAPHLKRRRAAVLRNGSRPSSAAPKLIFLPGDAGPARLKKGRS